MQAWQKDVTDTILHLLSATLVYTPLKNTISLLGINRKFNRNKLAI